MAPINVTGNWGTLVVDAKTGVVVTDDSAAAYMHIMKFDLAEYAKAYGKPAAGDIDILDLGYWDNNDLYIKADDYHREMMGVGWGSIIANQAVGKVLTQ
ncbi:MAG: hypothetical protein EOQ39_18540 [Mesorhizobium sp.]|uniref:hypothetical protein n=1 Tax=Mesorhizobium sp. TaxID=1871066 RepID=UPI000FEA650A|nr:hypothetical protein [Mesorhizobium sp.]RWB08828.1 MAG: hypothetical protein EOQ37_04805 [Mesorhizobium sp.]RWB13522.1 MAG: hypothetical protein EOQ39_18540 [Mesorhizobium sp.]